MTRSVAETLKTLRQLQEVDDRLGELREGMAALSLRVDEHKKRVAALEAELAGKTQKLKQEEKDSARKELDLKTLQEKLAKLRGQLNILKDNKQYTTMMHEINGKEAENSRTEDQALMLMDQVEGTRAAIEEVRRQIEEAKKAVRAEEAAVGGELRDLSGQAREITAQRRALAAMLEKEVIDKYHKIGHSRKGKAVVAVLNGVCQGCFMGVTKQTIARLWAQKDLMYCPNCACMMYLEGEVQ